MLLNFITAGGALMTDQSRLFLNALKSFDRVEATKIAQSLYHLDAHNLADKLFVPALEQLGLDWQNGDAALAQVFVAGRICEQILDSILPPQPPPPDAAPVAVVVLQDQHALGKRMVLSALRSAAIPVLDYGCLDLSALVARILRDKIQFLLLSTLMLPSALLVKDLKSQLKETNCNVKIAVGGAPFRLDPQLWQLVGADAVGISSSDAVSIVRQWTCAQ
jgi:methanogenic corrinoid protein MtbC1